VLSSPWVKLKQGLTCSVIHCSGTYTSWLRRGRRITAGTKLAYAQAHTGVQSHFACEGGHRTRPFGDGGPRFLPWRWRRPEPQAQI
jgi:hypothetical protein